MAGYNFWTGKGSLGDAGAAVGRAYRRRGHVRVCEVGKRSATGGGDTVAIGPALSSREMGEAVARAGSAAKIGA